MDYTLLLICLVACFGSTLCKIDLPFLKDREYSLDSKFPLGAIARGWGKWVYNNQILHKSLALEAGEKGEFIPRWNDDHNCDCSWEVHCLKDDECVVAPKDTCYMSECCGTRCFPQHDEDKTWQENKEECKEYCKQPDADKNTCKQCKELWQSQKEDENN